jgi:tetratricopeptide (TPR) repeat protein
VSSASEPETTPEQYRQRALLLADLGRYDEAADELTTALAAVPDDPELLGALARLHLAADQPAPALAAAERAVRADPAAVEPAVTRATALVDLQRYADAAQAATEVLARWPADPYAQRAGAAVLSESRNGQVALDAAWRAVSLLPTEADAHLALSVVAARLRLFDLARRAYAEALEIDPDVAEAQHDVGVVRLERRRWARALSDLAEIATGAVDGEPDGRPVVALPGPPQPDEPGDPHRIRQLARYGGAGTLVAGVLVAATALGSPAASRFFAAVLAVVGLVALGGWANRHVRPALGHDRVLDAAAYATLAAPLLLVAYAVVGGVVPLVAGMALAAVAELVTVFRTP